MSRLRWREIAVNLSHSQSARVMPLETLLPNRSVHLNFFLGISGDSYPGPGTPISEDISLAPLFTF